MLLSENEIFRNIFIGCVNVDNYKHDILGLYSDYVLVIVNCIIVNKEVFAQFSQSIIAIQHRLFYDKQFDVLFDFLALLSLCNID